MSAAAAASQDGPLALICGGGTLPLTVAESVSKRGRPVVIFALRGHADPTLVARYPHHWLRLGQLALLRDWRTPRGAAMWCSLVR